MAHGFSRRLIMSLEVVTVLGTIAGDVMKATEIYRYWGKVFIRVRYPAFVWLGFEWVKYSNSAQPRNCDWRVW